MYAENSPYSVPESDENSDNFPNMEDKKGIGRMYVIVYVDTCICMIAITQVYITYIEK